MSRLRLLLLAEQLRRSAPGGIGTYVLGLLQGLGALGPGIAPDLVLTASRPPGGRNSQDPLVALGHPLRVSGLPGPLLTRAWDHGLVRGGTGYDVIHAPSLATLEARGAALVVTVHDLLWRRVPDAYPRRGLRWHEAALGRALRRADRFVVPAQAVADDLVAAGAPSGAVTIIPMGCDHLPPPDHRAAASHLAALGVRGPFLLSVGTVEPRKNLQRLVEAYGAVRDALPEPWPLVMVGPSGWGAQVRPQAGVVEAGIVTSAELAALYASARLLAYVPLIEGFGLPPVEAMVLGTPVVSSPMPSTAGATFEVDPEDVASIAGGLFRVATDEEVRAVLVRRGIERSAALSWESIARRHVELWEQARTHSVPGGAA